MYENMQQTIDKINIPRGGGSSGMDIMRRRGEKETTRHLHSVYVRGERPKGRPRMYIFLQNVLPRMVSLQISSAPCGLF